MRSRPQGGLKPVQIPRLPRQAKPQEIVGPVEAAAPDVLCGQCGMDATGVRMPRQPEQAGSTGNDGQPAAGLDVGDGSAGQRRVERAGVLRRGRVASAPVGVRAPRPTPTTLSDVGVGLAVVVAARYLVPRLLRRL